MIVGTRVYVYQFGMYRWLTSICFPSVNRLQCTRFVDSHSTLRSPPSLQLYSLSDPREPMATLHLTKDQSDAASSLGLIVPEIVTVHADNGDTLYGAIYRPPADLYGMPHGTAYGGEIFSPSAKVNFGSPTAQLVTISWVSFLA